MEYISDVIGVPGMKWYYDNATQQYTLKNDVTNEIYKITKDLKLFSNVGFSTSMIVESENYPEDIEYVPRHRQDVSIIHYYDTSIISQGTYFDDVEIYCDGILIYPKDNKLSYVLSYYNDKTKRIFEGKIVADFISRECKESFENSYDNDSQYFVAKSNNIWYLITINYVVDEFDNIIDLDIHREPKSTQEIKVEYNDEMGVSELYIYNNSKKEWEFLEEVK